MIKLSSETPANQTNRAYAELAGNSEAIPVEGWKSPGAPLAPRRRTWMITMLISAGFALAIAAEIRMRLRAEDQLAAVTRESLLPSVVAVHPKAGAGGGEVDLPGNTQAFTDTPIFARVNGYLKSWHADIGTRVKSGQLLAEIDAPEVDQQLAQARADLKNAGANLQLAQITANRYQALLVTDAVSKQETDQAVSDLHSKQALLDSSQANVRRLEELQGFEHIYAPFDGVITARDTDIGALIQAGNGVGARELFHLASLDKLRIYISVPEAYVAAVQYGAPVSLSFDALFPGETFSGTLVRGANAIDLSSRTLNVEVDLDNSSGRVLPGAYAFVHLQAPASVRAVTIPANALLFRAQGLQVGVVRDHHVSLVPVTVGHDYGASVEIVSGLVPNDAVILDPSDSLEAGDAVQTQNPR